MYPPVNTQEPGAVQQEVGLAYTAMYPDGDLGFVPRVFGWALECFEGRYRDYQAVDLLYHDLEHTLQGTLCLGRILRGRHVAQAEPELPCRLFELALLGILLHDTGYLKRRDDTTGTGAKYTIVHVERSAEFAGELLAEKGFGAEEILAVQRMIRCTGIGAVIKAIPFQNTAERLAGFALASADLLGQMAAEDYVDKLPLLYEEFREAIRFSGQTGHFVATFSSAGDLMDRTPAFWQNIVLPKLDRDLGGLYRFLAQPHPDGRNDYLERIEANIDRLINRQAAPVQA